MTIRDILNDPLLRQYLVKWQGYDALNNSWCDENELYGIDCFTAYEKERRKKEKKLRKGRSMVIKSSSVPDGAVCDNYDSSSGDEDDRCTVSRLKTFFSICRNLSLNFELWKGY